MSRPFFVSMERRAGWLGWGAIGAFLAAFFVFTDRLTDAAQPLLLHLSVLLAVAVSALRLAAGLPLRLPAGFTWAWAALFVFWGLASRLWAERPLFVAAPAYQQLELFFLFLLMPQLVPDRGRLTRLAGVALCASSALAAASLVARLAGGAHSRMGFAYPTGNPNLTTLVLEPGTMLALGLALCLGRSRRPATAALLLHLAAIAAGRSMGGMLALAAGSLVLLAACFPRRRGRCLLLGLAGAGALVAAALHPPPAVRGSLELRAALWRQACSLYTSDRRTMLLGRGLGNYLPAAIPHRVPAYYRQPEQTSLSPHPHNLLLRTACELGAVGVALLCLLLVTLWRRARRLLAAGDDGLRLHGAVCLSALVCLLVHALVSWFLLHPLGQFLFWGWAGVLAAGVEQPAERERPRPLLGLLLGLVPLALLGQAYHLFVVRPYLGRLDAAHAARLMRGLERLPGEPERREQLRRAADFLARAVRLSTARGESEHSLAARARWGRAAFLAGSRLEALAIWHELEQLCPGYGRTRWRLAEAALALGRAAPARRWFLAWFDQDPTEPQAYLVWWDNRELLGSDPRATARVVAALDRGIEWLSPGPRREELVELRARFELLR